MKMRVAMLPVVVALLAVSCRQEEKPREPETPQEMYEEVRRLLQPNVEHDASEFELALHWLHRAAEGGLLQAQTDLGGIYLQGGKTGVKPDGEKAFYWFSKAAEQGSREAMFYMGHILHRGLGVPRDTARALELWRRAAEAGVAEAQYALGLALAQKADTVAEGVEWLTKAAVQPAPKAAAQAACALGNIYAGGKQGIAQDMAAAARWYGRAASGGDAPAQLVYAIMLLQGSVVPQDTKQGMAYLRLAAGQDNPQAIALLVNLLRNGQATPTAEGEAEAWAERLEKLRVKPPVPAAAE